MAWDGAHYSNAMGDSLLFQRLFQIGIKTSVCTDVGEMIKRVQSQSIRVIIQGRFYGCLPPLATCFAVLMANLLSWWFFYV